MYSDWLKIDLHIHTDKSTETKTGDYKGSFSISLLKEKLKSNGVSIFSLTDHNIINIDAYREYYESYNPNEDPLLLLGIEVDVQGYAKQFHTLLIFNVSDINTVQRISQIFEDTYTDLNIKDKHKRVLSFKDIATNLNGEDFFFIPHADHDNNIVKAHKGDIATAQRMILLMPSALEKVTNEERIKHYNDGFDKLCNPEFQNRNDVPYINFSDNHNCSKYPCIHMGENGIHAFYYIKGTKSFESIRLAFVDPMYRIKSTEQYNTEINRTLHHIKRLQIHGEKQIKDAELTFSPHLNVIIGGRSSGKSLLMWFLGKKINEARPSNKNYPFNSNNVSLQSSTDEDFKNEISLGNHLLYLNQGDIIQYFEEKKLNVLAEQAGRQKEYSDAGKQIADVKIKLLDKVNNVKNAYQDIQERGKTTLFTISNKQIIQAINSNTYILRYDKALVYKTYNTQEKRNAKSLLEEGLDNLNNVINNRVIGFTPEEKDQIQQVIVLYGQKLDLLKKSMSKDLIKGSFIEKVDNIIQQANSRQTQEAKQKQESRVALKSLINDIGQRFKLYKSLKDSATELEHFHYSEQVDIPINTEIKLVRTVKEKTTIKLSILDGISGSNENKSLYINLCDLLESKKSIKNYQTNSYMAFGKKIDKLINENIIALIDSPIDYLQYAADGATSEGKSPGYNSEQYLKIILDTPSLTSIFIDQPEDNLGNQYIANELVTQIRKIKFKKQLFLVTHNPSIVVYGDAENVILAENTQNIISYKQLVLEDLEAQKQICNILDGGKYIFHNRYQKYNIHRTLK